jgi:ABC-type transport system involved in multi-copper enzyme maturation permease subunit
MIPGPVFNFEILRSSRRARFYVMRAAYAAMLLLVFWMLYADRTYTDEKEVTVNDMSRFAAFCFCSVAVAQILVVLTLTPALVAGVIADEKQRKTLHYLLTSRLSGPEIVVGKLLARMLHVGVLLGVGFPVLSLLVLLGGIDPSLIAVACGAAASTAWFLAALAIWVSTIARRAREALFITYGLEFLWLFVPLMFPYAPALGWPVVDQIIDALMSWLSQLSPADAARQSLYALQSGGASPVPNLITMIQWQAAGGLLLALLAALQVRPVFRSQEAVGATRFGLIGFLRRRRSARLWPRPRLGNRPMLWKELFTSRVRGLARIVGVLVTLTGGGFLLYYTLWYGIMAFLEMHDQGYAMSQFVWSQSPERWRFYIFLRFVVPLLYVAGILNVAGAAAATITDEHEDDTWTSLTATDLTAREIIVAKIAGALWRPRGFVTVILLLTIAGIAVGAVHPLSLPLLFLALVVFGWFAAALGVCISLQLRSTWRAQFLATSLLFLINVLGQAILSNVKRWAPMMWPGFTPYEVSKTLLSTLFAREWSDYFRSPGPLPDMDYGPIWSTIFTVVSLTCYLAAAAGLTCLACHLFDRVAGRARRPIVPPRELLATKATVKLDPALSE